jgi:hypothetical protein
MYIIQITFPDKIPDNRYRYWVSACTRVDSGTCPLRQGKICPRRSTLKNPGEFACHENWDVTYYKHEATQFSAANVDAALMRFAYHFPVCEYKTKICEVPRPFRLSAGNRALLNSLGE